jgi:hypothetical protein
MWGRTSVVVPSVTRTETIVVGAQNLSSWKTTARTSLGVFVPREETRRPLPKNATTFVAPSLIDSALAERVSPSTVGRPTSRVAGSHEVSLAGSSLTTTTTR